MKYSSHQLDKEEYIQVAKNYYALRAEWTLLKSEERHIELCVFISTRRKNLMFTGQSACALYGIPRLDSISPRPHCISEKRKGTDFICWRHGDRDSKAKTIKGILVASPVRAICDLARYDSTASLLVSINHCLFKKLFSKEKLLKELEARQGRRYKNIIKKLLQMADNCSESPLETLAWIAINKAGFVLPKQQVKIMEKGIFRARVDMYWEVRKRKIILELDGNAKYNEKSDLIKEKRREDTLRRMGFEFIRVSWHDVEEGILEKMLIEA